MTLVRERRSDVLPSASAAARHAPCARARVVARGSPHRRGAPHRDHRRRPAHPRDGGRARLGELPELRGVRQPRVQRDRAGGTPSAPDGDAVDRRRTAGDLLLRRGPRAEARVRGRRPPRSTGGCGAGRGGTRRSPAARGDLSRGDQRHGPPGRLGDPDGHRHRLRTRSARRHRERAPGSAPDLPADPGGRRRPDRDHRDRLLLHRSPGSRSAAARLAPSRSLHCPGAAKDHGVVVADPARCRDLGPGARRRDPRHGRRSPVGPRRPRCLDQGRR